MNPAPDLDRDGNPSRASKIVELESMLADLSREDNAWDEAESAEDLLFDSGQRDISDNDSAIFEFDDGEEFEIDGLVFRVERGVEDLLPTFADPAAVADVIDLSDFLIEGNAAESGPEAPAFEEPPVLEAAALAGLKPFPRPPPAIRTVRPAVTAKEKPAPTKPVPPTALPRSATPVTPRQPGHTPAPPQPRKEPKKIAARPAASPVFKPGGKAAAVKKGATRGRRLELAVLLLLLAVLVLIGLYHR